MTQDDIILSIILSTLLILLLLAGIAISFFIASRQRSKQQFELAQARLNYEKELRKVELEVSEQLMQHFAQELHDNIGHSIACIRLELENKKIDHPEFENTFHTMETFVEDASQQLRLLSRSMNTDYIAQNGLLTAIDIEVERQRQLRKFAVQWEHNYRDHVLDKNQELIVFRIFQEIIHNAIKHSRSKNVFITLHSSPTFTLTVKDDGKGFQLKDTLETSRASGLKNIIRRASMAGLACDIQSTPGNGCVYHLSRPEPITAATGLANTLHDEK